VGFGYTADNGEEFAVTTYLHPSALCETASVGPGTRIWAFAHILPGASIGRDCNVCDGVFIENDVVVGDRVTIKPGVQLWDGARIADDVFIGPNATFTNDRFPRSRRHPPEYAQTTIQRGASVGANATILPGITIGTQAMIGAGAVVTKDVPAYAIVTGNPAVIVGYASRESDAGNLPWPPVPAATPQHDRDPVRAVRLPDAVDLRGRIVVTEFATSLPFRPERSFVVADVPTREIRGEHAHKACHQFLVCVSGSVVVTTDDGDRRQEFILDDPTIGLHVPPMVWASQQRFSADAVLQVYASHAYDPADYIREYSDFIAAKRVDRGEG
jgi:acetyltransferase-like isoleucine patch superfamily enzyme